ncbi:hypothetical protein OF83DRAFT_263295 [Amylostereum chailletii]|nr:hypothetical protein OF83DRAFT_263295 [Amylostereum chailletii]
MDSQPTSDRCTILGGVLQSESGYSRLRWCVFMVKASQTLTSRCRLERVLTTGSGRLPSEHDEDDGEDDSDSDSESDLESDEDEDEDEDEWEVWIDPSESPPYNLEPSDEVLAEIASTAASPQERLQMLYNRANPFVKLSVEKILYDIDPECLPESDRTRRGEFKELVRSLGESCDDIQKRLDALQALLQERYGNADCAVSKL